MLIIVEVHVQVAVLAILNVVADCSGFSVAALQAIVVVFSGAVLAILNVVAD